MNKIIVVIILIIALSFIPVVPYNFKLDNTTTEIRYKSIATIAYNQWSVAP